jgi:hypothetical protein
MKSDAIKRIDASVHDCGCDEQLMRRIVPANETKLDQPQRNTDSCSRKELLADVSVWRHVTYGLKRNPKPGLRVVS